LFFLEAKQVKQDIKEDCMGRSRKRYCAFILVLCCIMAAGCAGKKPLKMESLEVKKEQVKQTAETELANIPMDQRRYENISELRDIYFDYKKSIIREDSRKVLEENARWLKNNIKKQILIEGYCDERGTKEYNISLGERRADGVSKYYTAFGIDKSRIEILSWGEEKPVDRGHNEVAWAKNRRAETLIRIK